jgi:hypothetical protein
VGGSAITAPINAKNSSQFIQQPSRGDEKKKHWSRIRAAFFRLMKTPQDGGNKSKANLPLIMKKLITLLAVTASLAVLAPASSQAFDGHNSSRSFANNCATCRTPVYRERGITGHDRHGHPIFGYRVLSHNCRPSFAGYHHGHGGNSGPSRAPGFHFNFGSHSGHR